MKLKESIVEVRLSQTEVEKFLFRHVRIHLSPFQTLLECESKDLN
jgi:hypothetical protein